MDAVRFKQLIVQGHLEHSAHLIVQMEAEKKATLALAEQAVLNAIKVLENNWSVEQQTDALITIARSLCVHPAKQHGDWCNNEQDRDQKRTGSTTLVYKNIGHSNPIRIHKRGKAGNPHSDKMDSINPAWVTLRRDPAANVFCDLIIKLNFTLWLHSNRSHLHVIPMHLE